MSRVLITGASGFLGRALVAAARDAGAEVIALSRSGGDAAEGVTPLALDLGAPGAAEALAPHLEGVGAVIHAAASLTGDAAAHARDTVGATGHLISALEAQGSVTGLVLVSSLSVYDVAAMEDHTRLDEDMRMVDRPEQRDAYAAAKAGQEARVRRYQGPRRVIRPGAIYGPHRLWSAQLGFARGGVVVCPGGDAQMPAIEVTRAGAAIVRAALELCGAEPGARPAVNLIDPTPPTQAEWLAALGLRKIAVPRALVYLAGALTGRGPAWQARFRPLEYDTSQAQSLLDPATERAFADAVAAARQAEGGGS